MLNTQSRRSTTGLAGYVREDNGQWKQLGQTISLSEVYSLGVIRVIRAIQGGDMMQLNASETAYTWIFKGQKGWFVSNARTYASWEEWRN